MGILFWLLLMLPFLKGLALTYWVAGTWWIPLLLVLEFWRHACRGIPLQYVPEYRGLVFPLGMYATCTFELAQATRLPVLSGISQVFVQISLLAWTLAFLGLWATALPSLAQRLERGVIVVDGVDRDAFVIPHGTAA